jgi:ketosteroid isomerase-like protein
MTQQENVRTVEAVYAAFGRGDLGALLNTLAEDVVWQHPGPAAIPWAGERRGRDEVAQFFIAVNQHVEVEQFAPRMFVTSGDEVIVLGHERMRTRTGGRVYHTDWVHAFTVRGGRIVDYREYTDTAAIAEALHQEKPVALPSGSA